MNNNPTTEIVEQWTILNEAYFKKYAPIGDNINLKQIKPYFTIAEKIWLVPILGQPLYEELLEQVNMNTLTEENSTLYLMLCPYLSFAVMFESLPFFTYHFSEVGITLGNSDNSSPVSINHVNFINTRIRSTLETLKVNFKRWLNEHSDNFPLYTPDTCECSSSCTDCDWIIEYFNGGYRSHNWNYFMNKNKPQTRLQCFTTRRRNTDIQ